MAFKIYLLTYYSLLLISFVIATIRRRFLLKQDVWIWWLLLATIIFEAMAEIFIRFRHNNMPVFHIWCPIELLLICAYFSKAIPNLRSKYVPFVFGGVGLILAIVNALFWQPVDTINSIFLMYEAFTVIGFSLYTFYKLALGERDITKTTVFWFTSIFLLNWSSVFVYWGISPFFLTTLKKYSYLFSTTLWVVNVITYLGLSVIFGTYKKFLRSVQ